MSDQKHRLEHVGERQFTAVTLTAEQFESLYLQPRDPYVQGSLASRVGNPTPLGVSAFLLAHMPLAMDLLNFQGATAASGTAMLGSFYACAGIGLYLASIMEWIIGNTFPCVVFGTFGGFWTAYGIIVQPSMGLAASFAPPGTDPLLAASVGAATRAYNAGLGMYFAVWGILCIVYFIASLRTNVPFAIIFFSLIFAFELIAAAYFHTGQGRTDLASTEFRVAGGFALVTAISGFYIDLSLLLAAVGCPYRVPLFDLSSRIMVPKEHEA